MIFFSLVKDFLLNLDVTSMPKILMGGRHFIVLPAAITYRWLNSWLKMEHVYLLPLSQTTRLQLKNAKKMKKASTDAPSTYTVSLHSVVPNFNKKNWCPLNLTRISYCIRYPREARHPPQWGGVCSVLVRCSAIWRIEFRCQWSINNTTKGRWCWTWMVVGKKCIWRGRLRATESAWGEYLLITLKQKKKTQLYAFHQVFSSSNIHTIWKENITKGGCCECECN